MESNFGKLKEAIEEYGDLLEEQEVASKLNESDNPLEEACCDESDLFLVGCEAERKHTQIVGLCRMIWEENQI